MKKHIAAIIAAALVVCSFNITVFADIADELKNEINSEDTIEPVQAVNTSAQSSLTIRTGGTTEVDIDYRTADLQDIIIQENEIGALEKGKTINLMMEYIHFNENPEFEVIEGDVKIESVKVADGIMTITIGSASKSEPSTIRITNIKAELQRSLPAGDYSLYAVKGSNDLFFQDTSNLFDVDKLVLNDKYITIIFNSRCPNKAAEDQVLVNTNEGKMYKNGIEIPMDAPAYMSKDYVMLPLRAVSEAMSDSLLIKWDDATKTVAMTIGSRLVNMTVGSATMNINGVEVEMSKACEITDGRVFVPLRDLGYILGLSDNKIQWDAETMTATLN